MRRACFSRRSRHLQLWGGGSGCVSGILRFLHEDKLSHGTGYAKEDAWRYLRRFELASAEKSELMAIGVQYLHRRISREFRYMACFLHTVQTPEFRSRLTRLCSSENELVRKRAQLLAAYLRSPEEGMRMQRDLRYIRS